MKRVRIVLASLFLLLGVTLISCSRATQTSLVEYQRDGGNMRLDDRLTINPDGEVVLQRRSGKNEFAIDPTQAESLKNHLDSIGFIKLKDSYMPDRKGADRITYTVRHQNHNIITMDGSIPAELGQLFSYLDCLVNSASPEGECEIQ